MALHLIPSPHLGKNFPKFFISEPPNEPSYATVPLKIKDKATGYKPATGLI
jgi:hypothetical protein